MIPGKASAHLNRDYFDRVYSFLGSFSLPRTLESSVTCSLPGDWKPAPIYSKKSLFLVGAGAGLRSRSGTYPVAVQQPPGTCSLATGARRFRPLGMSRQRVWRKGGLPRCSPWRNERAKAGEGNRTLVCSLGSYRSTIELHPRMIIGSGRSSTNRMDEDGSRFRQ